MQKYDEDFLKRMRVRYLDLLKQDYPERTITFHSTFNELLFGEKDEEEIEIPTKEKKTKKSTKSSKKSVKKNTKKTALSKALESEWY